MIKVNSFEINVKHFASGESYFKQENIEEIKDSICKRGFYVDWYYRSDEELFILESVLRHLDSEDHYTTLRMWYTPHGRMDRGSDIIPFNLKYATSIISSLPIDAIEVYSPHSDTTVDLLENDYSNVKVNFVEPIIIKRALQDEGLKLSDIIFVYPDKGAANRYTEILKEFNVEVLIGEKVRDFNTGEIQGLKLDQNLVQEYHSKGKRFIIVDDICSYGGTFARVLDQLPENAQALLCVAHLEDVYVKGKLPSLVQQNKLKHIYAGKTLHWTVEDPILPDFVTLVGEF